MSINSVGVLIYGSVIMYIIMYWILWFFKAPYYKKMVIHKNEPAQLFCLVYFISMTFALGLEMTIIYHDERESPPFTFVGSCFLLGIWTLCCLPEWITNLRNKIPNRWEE